MCNFNYHLLNLKVIETQKDLAKIHLQVNLTIAQNDLMLNLKILDIHTFFTSPKRS